ncbi:MAG: hypothetical protein ACK55Z_17505, partial [bacterium]
MPVRQPLSLYEYLHDKKVKNRRAQARTQFGKRLLLLPLVEASEVIPAEERTMRSTSRRGPARILRS